MTWIKICGITNLEDARLAVDAGADALGFVFHPDSPRNTSAETVKAISTRFRAELKRSACSVDHERKNCTSRVSPRSKYISLPADAPENFPRSAFKKFLALNVPPDIRRENRTRPSTLIFLDSGTPDQPGWNRQDLRLGSLAGVVSSSGRNTAW